MGLICCVRRYIEVRKHLISLLSLSFSFPFPFPSRSLYLHDTHTYIHTHLTLHIHIGTTPRGSGGYANLQLYTTLNTLGLDLSLMRCSFGYNKPIIVNVSGCSNDIDECSRAGHEKITLYGANFGNDQAVVFIDGFPCNNVTHYSEHSTCGEVGDMSNDDETCDQILTCTTPPMRVYHTFNEHISVVQKDLYEDKHNVPGFKYAPCDVGTHQVMMRNTEDSSGKGYVNCTACEPGEYSDTKSAISCILCSSGTYTNEYKSTTCTFCPAGRYSNKEGSSECKMCKDYTTSDEGSDQCSSCTFIYMGSKDCSEPVVGILIGVFGSVIMIVTCFVGIRAYQKKDEETRLLKSEALHLKSDLNAATLKELEAKHDVEALTAASRIDWSSIELNDKPFAKGTFIFEDIFLSLISSLSLSLLLMHKHTQTNTQVRTVLCTEEHLTECMMSQSK